MDSIDKIKDAVQTIDSQLESQHPNKLIVQQALKNIEAQLPRLKRDQPLSPSAETAKAHLGNIDFVITVGDGFRFGVGFYLAIALLGFLFSCIIFGVLTIAGMGSMLAIFNELSNMQ